MLKKLEHGLTVAYIKAHLFIEEFRKDEHGLSGIVVAILLILIAVLAVVLLWDGLSDWLQDTWEKITGKADSIS